MARGTAPRREASSLFLSWAERACVSLCVSASESGWLMTGAALRGLALLGALGGTAGQLFPPPPPGYCQDTVDNPFSPNFRMLSKCCESGDTVEKHRLPGGSE